MATWMAPSAFVVWLGIACLTGVLVKGPARLKMPLVEGSSVLPDNAQNARENALADVRFSDLALRLILREFRRMALSGFRRRTIGVII